ncbi:MAG: tRNA (adenosine(37)-N6)-threonylcarbamoyltransferase complex ATPase subunit type 1 TsaE [Patescibacteria group bacterium]|jgi:tRNA threonylcarbamoyladenosine biosynthesis protein TsaE|nr:tRNA (adenosine(37)-N6)-threonylcarbamoyltransferase complex ATPase subunit type 1 TsaE [Patescibacteria group bacterium]
MKYSSDSVEKTEEIAQRIIENLEGRNVVLLQGELGAGKTTFSQSALKFLGAKGPFTSPTFVIMKKYELGKFQILNSKFRAVYHFDCYRVGSQDIIDLGWEEIISNPRNLVLVEWPERIEEILPKNSVKISLEIESENERKINIS